MCSPRLKPQLNNDFLLESKEDMKKRGVKSPDLADAIALTFASREFFTDYQERDTGTPAFGNLDHTERHQQSAIAPPLSAGGTSWMG
jgi:hypothetical protein